MRHTIYIILLLLLWTGWLMPCTIFKATGQGKTLVGNNEDWLDWEPRAWFLAPEENRYGRVYFGFINGWAQGGMNDQGLFFDWVSGYKTNWTKVPGKPDYFENISERILEEAATVDEALSICASYNIGGFSRARMMLVDKTGDAAIVGFKDNKLHIWRSGEFYMAMGARGDTAARMLRKKKEISQEGFAKILSKCRMRGKYQTRYSNVYDLQKGTVYLYDFFKSNKPTVLSLEKEFAKGHHYYHLPGLEKQLTRPPRRDTKTAAAIEISSTMLSEISGTYKGNKKSLGTIRIDSKQGVLYLWPMENSERHFRLYAQSKDVYFLRCMAGSFTIIRGPDGKVTGLLMNQAGNRHRLEKLEGKKPVTDGFY